MSDLVAAQHILRSTFGFEEFRPGQSEILAVLDGRDVLAVMPTGSGKSLCYQLPAMLRGNLTIVVSPLIALTRNQVAQLRGYGIAAAALNSANDPTENRAVLDGIARGELRLLYVAPERLVRPDSSISSSAPRLRCWRSTRRIAFRNGATTSGRNMRRSARCRRHSTACRPSPSPRPPMRRREPISRASFQPPAGSLRSWLRSAQFAAGDAGESRRPQASRGFCHGASRAKRHRLLQLAAQDRSARRISPRQRRQGAGLSRRHGIAGALDAIRIFSCRRTALSWWRSWRSAWASTSPMSASSSTPTCPPISRAIIRKSAAPAATGWPPIRSPSMAWAISACAACRSTRPTPPKSRSG